MLHEVKLNWVILEYIACTVLHTSDCVIAVQKIRARMNWCRSQLGHTWLVSSAPVQLKSFRSKNIVTVTDRQAARCWSATAVTGGTMPPACLVNMQVTLCATDVLCRPDSSSSSK